MSNQHPYSIQTITDNLYFTIIKVVVHGDVPYPSLLIDAHSLIGINIESAIDQFGGGLPRLPDIHCLSSTINNKPCQPCLANDNLNSQLNIPSCSYSGQISNTQSNNEIGTHGFVSPEVITQNDLVTFIPPPLNLNFLGLPINSNDITSLQNTPAVIYGMGSNTAKINYALISVDQITNLLYILNQTSNGGLYGEWKNESDHNFRFYYSGLQTYNTILNENMSQSELLDILSNISFNKQVGNWVRKIGNNFTFQVNGQELNSLSIGRAFLKTNEILEVLNMIPIEGQLGIWEKVYNAEAPDGGTLLSATPLDIGIYQFKFTMASTNVLINLGKLQLALYETGWSLTELVNGIYTYQKKKNLIRVTPTGPSVNIVGNQTSNRKAINDIGEKGWEIAPTTSWKQSLAQIRILPRYERNIFNTQELNNYLTNNGGNSTGVYEIIGPEQVVKLLSNNIPREWLLNEGSKKFETVIISSNNIDDITLSNWNWTTNEKTVSSDGVNYLDYSIRGDNILVSGFNYNIAKLAEDVLIPKNITYRPFRISENQSIKITSTRDRIYNTNKTQIQGDLDTLQRLKESLPEIFSNPEPLLLRVIQVSNSYNNFIGNLSESEWEPVFTTNRLSEFIQTQSRDISFEVYDSSCQGTTIWGTQESIDFLTNYLKQNSQFYQIQTSIQSKLSASILNLGGNDLPNPDYDPNDPIQKNPYLQTFQIISTNQILDDLNQKASNVILQKDIVYTSITVELDTNAFINLIKNYDYGIGKLGWKRVASDTGCENESNMYRFYLLVSNGLERGTPYFIYLYTIGKYTKIEGLQEAINRLIIPVLAQFRVNFIKAGEQPKIPGLGNQVNLTVGKVTGLTGNIKKLPTCDAPPRLAITNINWSLNNDSTSYVELLWETDENVFNGIYGTPSIITGETAFIFSNNGNYGLGSLNSGNGNTLVDGGGQPGIPNNAFPNPTGNVMFRTKGRVNGTFTIKFNKYSGYYNSINFFDNPATNLQAAIQANELIHRDWIRQVKHNYESSQLIPFLFNAESNSLNRSLRPSSTSNGIITFEIKGSIIIIGPNPNKTISKKQFDFTRSRFLRRGFANDPSISRGTPLGDSFFNDISPKLLGLNNFITNNIELDKVLNNNSNEKIIRGIGSVQNVFVFINNTKISDDGNDIIYNFDLEIPINFSKSVVIPENRIINKPTEINKYDFLIKNILNLNNQLDLLKLTSCHSIFRCNTNLCARNIESVKESLCLNDITDLKITAELGAQVIFSNDSRIRLEYSNIYGNFFFEEDLLQKLRFSEINSASSIRLVNNPSGTDSFGARHQIGGINVANYSRWEETQVKRLLYASEFPLRINKPNLNNPHYTFQDGSRVDGILHNALGTGVSIPINATPPLIVPPSPIDQNGNVIPANLVSSIGQGVLHSGARLDTNPSILRPELFQYNLNPNNPITTRIRTNKGTIGFNTRSYTS